MNKELTERLIEISGINTIKEDIGTIKTCYDCYNYSEYGCGIQNKVIRNHGVKLYRAWVANPKEVNVCKYYDQTGGLELKRLYRCPICNVAKGDEHKDTCEYSNEGLWDGGYKVKIKINGEVKEDWWTWKKNLVNIILTSLKRYPQTQMIGMTALSRALADVSNSEWKEYEDPIDLTFQHIMDRMIIS